MTLLYRLASIVRWMVHRSEAERDLNDELEAFVDMAAADKMGGGVAPAEARRLAVLQLGGVEQAKERVRTDRHGGWLDEFGGDLRYGLRQVRRNPAFSAVAIAMLALGIGANTVMFAVANTLLLRPLPYHDPERLVSVQTVGQNGETLTTSPPDFYALRERNRTLEFLDAYYVGAFNLTGGRDAERLPGLIVSSGFFSSLGVPPALGRSLIASDEQWGSHRVVLLTDGLWKRRFGANPAIVGTRITLNAQPYTVIGVLPPIFSFLGRDLQVFAPMAFEPGDNMNSYNNSFLSMVGRLKPGVAAAAVLADLNRVSDELNHERPLFLGISSVGISPLRELLVRNVRQSLLVLFGAVALVLLIACANLANLLLARGVVRAREMAVRTAMGATRSRLIRQLLTESLALAIVGGLVGAALASVSLNWLNLLSQTILPRAEPISLDPAVIVFTFGAAALTGVLFGLVPALRNSVSNVNDDLKEGARTASTGTRSYRLRTALVVTEVALSLVLLIGAGLLVKSMYRLLNVDTGFDPDGVLTMQINLPAQKYVDAQLERRFSPLAYSRANRFFTEAIARVRGMPGVDAVGAVSGLPLMGEVWSKNLTLYDRPLPSDISGLPSYQYRVVVGDYFRAMGIRLLDGRVFEERDNESSMPVVVVNREAVRRFWDGQSPIGKTVTLNPPLEIVPEELVRQAKLAGMPDNYAPPKFTVVGVVDDVRGSGLMNPVLPTVYAPYVQGSEGATSMFLAVRTRGEPPALVGAIREQVRQIDPDQPVANILTMEARLAASVSQKRTEMVVLGVFASLALLLAMIGIYGVMAFWVSARRKEIGIRMALGAGRSQVLSLVLRQTAVLLAVGVSLGLLGSFIGTRVLQSLLFEVRATDPAVFVTLAFVLAVSAGLAAYLPARMATRVDPATSLRSE